jgi:hypothetical protein
MLDVISKTSINDLKDIIIKTFEDIKELNNENSYEQYNKFINSL